MGFFLWTADVARAVKEVREYAEKPENWYRVHPGAKIPGDDRNFVVYAGTMRAVFTWTVAPLTWRPGPGAVIRHLTISATRNLYPRPEVCWTFAHYFGFTGAMDERHGLFMQANPDWFFNVDKDERCSVIQQIVAGVKDAPRASADP